MLRPQVFLSAAGLSAVAAIASVAIAWPEAIAQSRVTITAKQAALRGVPATAEREEIVSKLIVKLRASSSAVAQSQMATHMRSLSAAAGVGIKSARALSGEASLLTLNAPLPMSEARALAARLAADPTVEYAEPDFTMKPFAVPNEAQTPGLYTTKQWNLFLPATPYEGIVTVPVGMPAAPNKISPAIGAANLPVAWDSGTGSNSVVIAIVDTGIVNHPDLNNAGLNPPSPNGKYVVGNRFLKGYDFVSPDPLGLGVGFVENDADPGRDDDPTDPGDAIDQNQRANPLCNDHMPDDPLNVPNSWHGSHSAGVAAATANNMAGIAGIASSVRVLPVRALGRCGGSMTDVADAIRWAAGLPVPTVPTANANANPAKVISVGAGGKAGTMCGETLQRAINDAIGAGSVVVVAAGNEGELNLGAPANCDGVITVTAHLINGENAQYSNVGSQVTISAPGGGPTASQGIGDIDNDRWDGYYIWSTTIDNATGMPNYGGRIGTSAAAAQVAGVAALIIAKAGSLATPVRIKEAFTTSARPFPENTQCPAGRRYAGLCGAGMLDATRALQAAGPPVVVTAPKAASVAVGATVSFTVEAIGVVGYQWTRAGANIAGATGPSYTTPALTATDNNVAFAVVMTNSFGTTTSPTAVVTVNSPASNSPSGGGALPLWQLLLLSALLLAGRVRIAHSKQ